MLDNRYALLFIRGEPYRHGEVTQSVAGITLGDSLAGEVTEEMSDGESYEILSDEELEAMLNQEKEEK